MFKDDYAQYDASKGFTSSISIPTRIMMQFGPAQLIKFSFDVPPGAGSVRVMSATIAYPANE